MTKVILSLLAVAVFGLAFLHLTGPTAAWQPADSMRVVMVAAAAVLGICAWLTGRPQTRA